MTRPSLQAGLALEEGTNDDIKNVLYTNIILYFYMSSDEYLDFLRELLP